jgi:large subunit ribosomal protein L21
MKFAIIETGGKQYLVSPGDKIQVEKLVGEKDAVITFDKVLATFTDKDYSLGKPLVSGAAVEAKVLKQGRGKKIEVLKYKAKSKYRRKIGHRQSYTEVEITSVK